ncbi:hypothetical protein [Mycolicibacterium sphagni]|uniref:Integrase n=1 Tax=Mycolicibacterium sphagni TaxID=1786 RepID=A0ABX2JXY1_9MYCO|nr:hypothetical protein [Mycolicibacterium sphagni]NTY62516.1 hypothetical protein [Mycolicibacterium sphagni]
MTTASQPAAQKATPDVVWKRLAPMIAAPGRAQMRLYDARTTKFSDTARLTDSVPTRPAAVYLYAKGRTEMLVLDFDIKEYGAARAHADFNTAAAWLSECGAAIISDRSTNGGRHLLCPLAIGVSATCDEISSLVRLLAARLPTLDITPATNARTGCISVPGSPDKYGSYRRLDGTLDAAVEALTTRSAPELIPRLLMLLGALKASPRHTSTRLPTPLHPAPVEAYVDGVGDDQRLAPAYRRTRPLPDDVADFAANGTLSPSRPTWRSNHEARMSVVVHAVARGFSLRDLQSQVATGAPWHDGLGAAYARYRHRADLAMTRDYSKALNWYVTNVVKSSPPRHKEKNYTPGGRAEGWRGPKNLREWLANALVWADAEFSGQRYRWTVHAVLQCLAFYAHVAGEHRSGAWLVGVGGRTLSLGSGLLSEDTVWRVLADLRDRPGAPLILVRRAIGTEADHYALTMHNVVTADPIRAQRVRVEAVHEAWSVLGHHLRRVYELVAYHGLAGKSEVYASARVPRATGDAMVTALQTAGLLAPAGWGTVTIGPVTLDDIAARHRVEEVRLERLQRHRAERAAWRRWLEEREHERSTAQTVEGGPSRTFAPAAIGDADAEEHAAWQRSVMATGPPGRDEIDEERVALDIIADILGGRLLSR